MHPKLLAQTAFLAAAIVAPRVAIGQTLTSAAFDEDRAQAVLDHSLNRRNPDQRIEAVRAMASLDPHQPFVSRLESMLNDKDVQVRLATIESLSGMNSEQVIPALKRALDDKTPEVRFAAAKALFQLNDPSGRDALLSVLTEGTGTSSKFITRQAREYMRLVHTPKPLLMVAIKQGIGFAEVPGLGAGASILERMVLDSRVSGRAATASLLANSEDPRVLAALKSALVDKDSRVRAAAVRALALRNDPRLEADLLPLLNDQNDVVRINANAACLRLEWIKSKGGELAIDAEPNVSLLR